MNLSVVSTLYRSSAFIDEFVARTIAAAEAITPDFEIILVNDGSPDDSLAKAVAAAKRDCRIRVVNLARNFGHHAAILTGLELALGERVFLVDSDLEEEPELLLLFAEAMKANDADVVYGVHNQDVGSAFRQVTSGSFWRLFNLLSETKTEPNICHVRLMKRDYLDSFLSLKEKNIFLGGLYNWPGYHQLAVKVERKINRTKSTYNFGRRLALLVRSIVAFSTRPLQIIFVLGAIISGMSVTIALIILTARLVMGSSMLSGFASLMISIWFLSGLIIMSLGIIGLYIAQVYIETKNRPRAIIRSIYSFPPQGELPIEVHDG